MLWSCSVHSSAPRASHKEESQSLLGVMNSEDSLGLTRGIRIRCFDHGRRAKNGLFAMRMGINCRIVIINGILLLLLILNCSAFTMGSRNRRTRTTTDRIIHIKGSTEREGGVKPKSFPLCSTSSFDPCAQYLKWIDASPLLSKSISAAVVGCLGDVLAQWLEAKTQIVPMFKLDWVRLNAFFVSGLFFVGPFLHIWYDRLWAFGRWLNDHLTKSQDLQVLGQMMLDQTVGVLMFFPFYFYVFELSEAFVAFRVPSFAAATDKLLANLGDVFLMQYKVWPLANFLNFKFVPEGLRVLTSNLVAVFWNAYLCTRLA